LFFLILITLSNNPCSSWAMSYVVDSGHGFESRCLLSPCMSNCFQIVMLFGFWHNWPIFSSILCLSFSQSQGLVMTSFMQLFMYDCMF